MRLFSDDFLEVPFFFGCRSLCLVVAAMTTNKWSIVIQKWDGQGLIPPEEKKPKQNDLLPRNLSLLSEEFVA